MLLRRGVSPPVLQYHHSCRMVSSDSLGFLGEGNGADFDRKWLISWRYEKRRHGCPGNRGLTPLCYRRLGAPLFTCFTNEEPQQRHRQCTGGVLGAYQLLNAEMGGIITTEVDSIYAVAFVFFTGITCRSHSHLCIQGLLSMELTVGHYMGG